MVSRIKFSAGGWRGNYAESRYVTGRRKLANFRIRGKGGRREGWTILLGKENLEREGERDLIVICYSLSVGYRCTCLLIIMLIKFT